MKIFDIIGNIRIPLNLEEESIVNLFQNVEKIYKKDLKERQEVLTKNMVTRGILERSQDNNGVFFTLRQKNVWRN